MSTDTSFTDANFPYSVPSRRCEPIIQTAILNFHDKTIPNPLSSKFSVKNEVNLHFGIISLNIRDEIPAAKELEINFMVDCSASMTERVDKLTKMDHVIHTIKNMVTIFHKLTETNVKLCINSFDDKTYTNVNTGTKNVCETDLDELLEQVSQITPQGATNIELALIKVKTLVKEVLDTVPDKIHLFLTDGCITSGSTNIDYLKTLVNHHYTNYFIGYGLDHDSQLLAALAETGQHNEYRFVDALEKAGLVYGEIIHDILYKALEDVVLDAENCEMYDYATNTWTTHLEIGHLSSEQKKTYQIRAPDPKAALIWISARSLHKTRAHQIISNDIVFQTHASCVSDKCDLSDYFLRQKTQELLYKVKTFTTKRQKEKQDLYSIYDLEPNKEPNIDLKKDLKEELKTFLNFLLDYITLHNREKDLFLRTLCDDMYIVFKTFDSAKAAMFVNSRQTSQGRQQTYSVRSNFEDESETLKNHVKIPMPMSCPFDLDDLDLDLDLDLLPPVPVLTRSQSCSIRTHINQPDKEDDIKYTIKQDDDSAYASLGIIKMMREVSIGPSLKF